MAERERHGASKLTGGVAGGDPEQWQEQIDQAGPELGQRVYDATGECAGGEEPPPPGPGPDAKVQPEEALGGAPGVPGPDPDAPAWGETRDGQGSSR